VKKGKNFTTQTGLVINSAVLDLIHPESVRRSVNMKETVG